MGSAFGRRVYVVVAMKDGQTKYWAAAMRRDRAAAAVQQLLPLGWKAVVTRWRLTPGMIAKLNMRANSVCRLNKTVAPLRHPIQSP
jgi:hypothetical protein